MTKTQTNNPPSPKENKLSTRLFGSAYPWIVIVFCLLFLFYKYTLQVSPSVMTDQLMRYFHINGAGLGNLVATYFYAYLITQIFVGPLLDKYSTRLLATLAIIVSAFGAFAFADAHTLLAASFARALIGVGAAFGTVTYIKLASIWFKPHQFAFVSGFIATGAMIGSMAGQGPLAILVSHVGWHATLRYCGLLGLIFAVIFYTCVRDKNKSRPLPKDEHQKPHKLSFRECLKVFQRKRNWLLMFYSGLAFAPLAVFGGLWGNPFLQETYHLTKPETASLLSMSFFGFGIGGPLFGMLSDRLGKRFEVMLAGLILSFISLAAAIYMPGLPPLLEGLLLFLFGLGTGAFMLGFALGKEMNHIAFAATVAALVNTGDALFGAFSEPLVGKMLDVFWDGKTINGVHYFSVHDFHISLLLLPTYLLLALIFLVQLKPHCRNLPTLTSFSD